jgi:hypothetical protein
VCLLGLTTSEIASLGLRERDLRRLFRLMPPKERAMLRLYHRRGATQEEIAELLGTTDRSVRRALKTARQRLCDPVNLGLAAGWPRLDPRERQFVTLYRFKGLPLRKIVRLGLVAAPPRKGRPGSTATLSDLRAMDRRLVRKARRARRRRDRRRGQPDGPDAAGAGGAASSSTG